MDQHNVTPKRRTLEFLSVVGVLLGSIAALLAAILGQDGIRGLNRSDVDGEAAPTASISITNDNSATGGNANAASTNPVTEPPDPPRPPLNPPSDFVASPSPTEPEMSQAEYDRIQQGMTYQEVVAIVGTPGTRQSSNGPFETYEWEDTGPFGVSVTFNQGRVSMIGSYGHGANLRF